jgi:signal transduction histidine kinase/DNA-binding response OmpR family regulator
MIFEPIIYGGQRVGTLYLQSTLDELHARVRRFTGVVALILVGTFFVALLLSNIFQRIISEPILELTKATRLVSEEKNYSIRALKRTDDEVGFLIDGFNDMLGQIEKRERALEEANNQLVQSEQKAMAATQAKSAFLANMSHELRTPLNAIIGFSEMLADRIFGDLNERQSRYIQNILNSGKHLLQLINDILDLAKIEAGRLELEPTPFCVATALEDVQNIVKTLANKKSITLRSEIAADLPDLYADQPKFKQIMYNLLSNAIKFTPDGGTVTIMARLEPATLDQAANLQPASSCPTPPVTECLHVSVRDTGIGIKPQDQERVFLEFEQADSSYARQQQGTGLGLSLTRKLVEMHGGRISVESEGVEGKGSTFAFLIPIVRPPSPPVSADDSRLTRDHILMPNSESGAAARALVLVIEDDPAAGELLREYLSSGGYAVAHAWDGEQAIRLARELRPYAITLDIMLPKKSGWEVLSELKSNVETKEIPVVIISISDDLQLGFSLGAVEYCTKPVSRERLLEVLHRAGAALGKDVQTVLVIDDEPMSVEFVTNTIENAGFNVLRASDGLTGLQTAGERRPDLVVLDLIMPGMSGFEVVQRLRSNPETKDIPILIYTARDLNEEERQRLKQHVQAIARKSGKDDLLRELERLARLCKQNKPVPK